MILPTRSENRQACGGLMVAIIDLAIIFVAIIGVWYSS